MKRQGKGRFAVYFAGAGALAVLVLALAYRHEIWKWYLELHWKRIDAVVLDNCDPDFRGAGTHGDGIRFLDRDGKELFSLPGFNNAETVGAQRAIALDPERFRIYLRENVSGRVTALDSTGGVIFKLEKVVATSLAVDPATGNLWCLTGQSLGQGETAVFDPDGRPVATYPIQGFDIAYDPHHGVFWAAGYEVTRFDREGRVLAKLLRAGWARVSVAPDPRDGSAWIAEREHPNVRGSANRLVRVDDQGQVVREIALGAKDPFGVACDPKTGAAWVAVLRKEILRVPVDGPPLDSIPIAATAIGIGSQKGSIWAATSEAMLHLSEDGGVAATWSFKAPSSQSWIAVP